MKKTFIIFLIIGIISVALGFITDRSICIFLNLTGVPCASCGMTKGIISFIKGDLLEAFHYHPLFFMPVIVILINHKKVRKNKAVFNRLVFSLTAIFLAVYVIRLVKLFPNKEPFLFYPKALLPMIFRFVKNLFN